jgi:hypothetical protein
MSRSGSMMLSVQRLSEVPDRYQLEPLSAMKAP